MAFELGSLNLSDNYFSVSQTPGTLSVPQPALTSSQKQARFSSKSISTDGAEGRCLNEPKPKPEAEPVPNLASANETVASFLRSIAFKEEEEVSQASSFETPMSTVTFEQPQVRLNSRECPIHLRELL